MRKFIVLSKWDFFKKSNNDYDNPSISDFSISKEDKQQAELIIYIKTDDDNPNKVTSTILKAKYDDDRYDDIISTLLSDFYHIK
jgi:hypothetical protein